MPNKANPKKIAYLAPEIPALSATFVYNEILYLQKMGLSVTPFSVHRPASQASESAVLALSRRVHYLYETSKISVLMDQLRSLITQPVNYIRACRYLLSDILSLGISNRAAIGMGYRFFYAATLAKQLKELEIQHLHVHFAHIPTDIAMYASAMSGVPFSVQAHANDLFERGWLIKQKVSRSAFFATISEFNQRFLKNLGADESKIKIIRCGVDTSWQPPSRIKDHNNRFTIGTVGRLVEKKGIDTLIKTASIFKANNHDIQILIAGSGPLENDLRAQVQELNLSDKEVRFIGALPHDEVALFINTLDVFVLPCKKDKQGDMDGIPVVLMEAMLCNIPVVSTQLSGIPELVIHNKSGLLVEPDNATQLAEAIIRLKQSPAEQNRLKSGGQQRVNEEFLIDKNVSKLVKLING